MPASNERALPYRHSPAAEVQRRIRELVKHRYGGIIRDAAKAWDLGYGWVYYACQRPRQRSLDVDSLVIVAVYEGVGIEWLLGLTDDPKDGRPLKARG